MDSLLKFGVKLDFSGNQDQFLANLTRSVSQAQAKLVAAAAPAKNPAQSISGQLRNIEAQGHGRIDARMSQGLLSPAEGRAALKDFDYALTRIAHGATMELRAQGRITDRQQVTPPPGPTAAAPPPGDKYWRQRDAAKADELAAINKAKAAEERGAAAAEKGAAAAQKTAERREAAAKRAEQQQLPLDTPDAKAASANARTLQRAEAARRAAERAADQKERDAAAAAKSLSGIPATDELAYAAEAQARDDAARKRPLKHDGAAARARFSRFVDEYREDPTVERQLMAAEGLKKAGITPNPKILADLTRRATAARAEEAKAAEAAAAAAAETAAAENKLAAATKAAAGGSGGRRPPTPPPAPPGPPPEDPDERRRRREQAEHDAKVAQRGTTVAEDPEIARARKERQRAEEQAARDAKKAQDQASRDAEQARRRAEADNDRRRREAERQAAAAQRGTTVAEDPEVRRRREQTDAARKADEDAREAATRRQYTLPGPALDYYRTAMENGTAAQRAVNAGDAGALDRLYGLWVGTAQELAQMNTTLGAWTLEARANLDSLQRLRRATESLASERQRIKDLRGETADRDLAGPTRDLYGARRERQLIERGLYREGTSGLLVPEGADLAETRRRRRDIEAEALGQRTEADTGADAELARSKRAAARATSERVAREEGTHRQTIEAEGALRASRLQWTRSVKRAEAEELRARGFGAGQGTWTQRLQAYIANRQGGVPRTADEFLRGPQLLTSRLLTTASFAASGGLLYGALNLGGNIVRESTELQRELSIIRTQFKLLDETANGITFDQFRDQIRATARETGTEMNEVANVQRQLAGAFADQAGRPNFDRAASEGNVALKYSQISGLPQQEITDSLTAISLAFRDAANTPLPFEDIADTVTDLENRFGVLGPEIVKFTADLAPLGKELGFTQEQLSGLGAVAQQKSGKSGAVLAEQLGRILPTLQEKSAELFEMFESNPATESMASTLLQAFDTGNTPDALRVIIDGYDKLDDAQKKYMASLVGGRREAATFYALLDSPTQTLKVLDGGADSEGRFQERWKQNTDTVKYSVDRMRRSVEQAGEKIFSAGLDDFLKGLADAGAAAGVGLGGLVEVFNGLNDVTGGTLPRLLATAAVLTTISRLSSRAGGVSGILSFLSNGAVTAGVNARAAGGLLSPMRRGAPILDAAGTVVGNEISMRPSTLRAERTPGLRNLLTRNAGGGVTAGVGTALASGAAAAAPVIAATLASFVISDAMAYKDDARQARKDMGDRIQGLLKKDLSPQQIKAKLGNDYSNNRDSVRDSVWEFIFGATDVDETIKEEISRRQAKVTADQLDAVAATISYYNESGEPTKLSKQVQEAINEAISSDQVSTKLQTLLGKMGAYPSDSGPYPEVGENGQFKFKGKITPEVLQKIAKFKRDNPTNLVVDQLIDMLRGLLPKEMLDEWAKIFDESNDPKPPTNAQAIEKAVADYSTFETKLERARTGYRAGRGSSGQVITLLTNKRQSLEKQLASAIQNHNETRAAEYENLLAQLDDTYNDFITSDVIGAASQFRASLRDAVGTGGNEVEAARANEAAAKADYDELRRYANAGDRQRAEAAVKLIAAQRERLDAEIAAATDPAEIARLVAQGVKIDKSTQLDLISGQLTQGSASIAVQQVAAAFDTSTENARAVIANQIQTTDSIIQSALYKDLERRKKAIETMIENVKKSHGTADSKAALLDSLNADLDATNSALAALPGLDATVQTPDNVEGTKPRNDPAELNRLRQELAAAQVAEDPIASAQQAIRTATAERRAAEAAGDDEAALRAQIAEVQARQQLMSAEESAAAAGEDLAIARLERDPVASARQQVANAAAAVGRADGAAERLSAMAQQVRAQHALEDAMFAMYEAQMDVANAMSESVGDTVAVAKRQAQVAQAALDRARGNGTGGAELQALLAAAIRANTNAVEAARSDRLDDLDYLYEFDRITANQYINLLQAELEKIPEANKSARRDIERRIRALRDEMSQNLAFNIPTEIRLPTLYEARRLGTVAGTAGASYVDSRVITITVNEARDGRAAVNRAIATVGSAARVGTAAPSARSRFI